MLGHWNKGGETKDMVKMRVKEVVRDMSGIGIKEIVGKLISKRELKDIDESFVQRIVEKSFSGEEDKREFRQKFKEVRKMLRRVYGMFRQVREKRGSEVYEKVFEKVGKVKSVLDLGCGLSALDFPFDKYKVRYYGCDISKKDVERVRDVEGVEKVLVFDLVFGDYSKLPEADVCFCFKVLEGMELVEKGSAERLLKSLRCKNIVVSFAKRSLGGRKVIKKQGRVWFMKLLNKLGWGYEIFNTREEIFFVVCKI